MKFDDVDWENQFKAWTFFDLTRLLQIVEHARNEKMTQEIRRRL
jgi:hypothetical protein